MNRWAQSARKLVPASNHLDERELYNSLPDFIFKLSEIISTGSREDGGERYSEELVDICRAHGAQRSQIEAYTLDQVITEHRLLRRTIIEVFQEKGYQMNQSELTKLLESIDYALVQSSTEFASRLGFEKSRKVNELEAYVQSLKSERILREQFVSTLTHDLRTPLTAIKAAGEMVLRHAENINLARTLSARIVEAAVRLDKMVRDLLDANRIRAGQKLNLALSECDLVEIIQSSISELSTHHGERFVFQAPAEVKGYWSADELRRVFENLSSNAIKYGDPQAPVTVRIEEAGNKIRLLVHNQGNALSPAEQTGLFRQFERSKSAQASGKRGWGIGLTLVRGVAEAHGGQVGVESSPEKGTTFIVELPRDARAANTAA